MGLVVKVSSCTAIQKFHTIYRVIHSFRKDTGHHYQQASAFKGKILDQGFQLVTHNSSSKAHSQSKQPTEETRLTRRLFLTSES